METLITLTIIAIVSFFIIRSALERRDINKRKKLKELYSPQYIKKLEVYMEVTRQYFLIYDSVKTPQAALVCIESIRRGLDEIDKHLTEMNDYDRISLSETIKNFRNDMNRG